jgi:hypothetical protein
MGAREFTRASVPFIFVYQIEHTNEERGCAIASPFSIGMFRIRLRRNDFLHFRDFVFQHALDTRLEG